MNLPLKKVLHNVFAGLTVGLVNISYSISFAALIFSGLLSPFFLQGMGSTLISSVVTGVVVSLRSSFPFAIASPDSNSIAILALIASAIAEHLYITNGSERIFPTVWMAIALSTLLTGFVLYTIGKLRLGRWARFIPYTVMGGFLAGTGWLITRASFKVMVGFPLGWNELPRLMQWGTLVHWLPGLIFAVIQIAAGYYFKHALVLPSLLVGGIILFHFSWWEVNLFVPVSPKGWFLEAFPTQQIWHTWNLSTIAQVDWNVLMEQGGNIFAMVVVVAIAILLNAAGIEIATQRESKLDRELCANGIANLITGACGGVVGNLTINRTLLNRIAGANSPLAGLVAVAFSATVLLCGSQILAYIPKSILGGLLLAIGLKLLIEWIYRAWFKFPHLEYALIIIILLSIAAFGFLEGVGVGIIIACALFAYNYSRLQIIRHTFSGATYQSNVQRCFPEQQVLRQEGEQVYILLLQSYIFFGTANALLEQVNERFKNTDLHPIQFLVLDFRLVSGLDSSAVLSFIKLRQFTQKHQLHLVFTHLPPKIQHQLEQGGCTVSGGELMHIFPDLDRGIEWCENQILETFPMRRGRSFPLALQLNEVFQNADQVSNFISYLERISVPAQQTLFHQGCISDALYFIESGQITVFLQSKNGNTRRLQTINAGTIVGEIAFYLDIPYQTTAITEQPSQLYCLTKTNLQKMQQENPQITANFQAFVIRLLSDRLLYTYREVEELL